MPIGLQNEVQKRFEHALEALMEKVRQDRNVLAAILFGSLSYDEVWEKSDVDMWFVTEDGIKSSGVCLVEQDINFHIQLIPGRDFKKRVQGTLTGSWMDFTFSKTTLMFSKDESIEAWYKDINRVGARDQAYQLLQAGSFLMAPLQKAEKYFHLKQDYEYAFIWATSVVRALADIEVLMHGVAPTRESIHQALKYNPEFFKVVYTDLINQPKTRENLQHALDLINHYLDEKALDLFLPILDYLTGAGEVRTLSEIGEFFRDTIRGDGLEGACEWLAQKEIIEKRSSPIRLTEKSRVSVEEPAYYYDAGAADLT